MRIDISILLPDGGRYTKVVLFPDMDPAHVREGLDIAESVARYVFWSIEHHALGRLMASCPEDFSPRSTPAA